MMDYHFRMNKKYKILVNGSALRTSRGEVYIYDTYEEAHKIVCMCYGEDRIGKTIKIIEEIY
jgi:hypothetical protein